MISTGVRQWSVSLWLFLPCGERRKFSVTCQSQRCQCQCVRQPFVTKVALPVGELAVSGSENGLATLVALK
jgi:hypothetical protein